MRISKLVIFSLVLSGLGFLAFKPVQPETKNEILIKLLMQGLNSSHYAPPDIDDTFSKEVFDLYLERLDYSKRYFTQADVSTLKVYENRIDEDIRDGQYNFFNKAEDIYNYRFSMVKEFYKEILTQPFDFTAKEVIELDGDDLAWAKDEKELKERWRKSLKFQVLGRLQTELELQEKDASEGKEKKDFAQLEQDARVKVMKTYDDWVKRMEKLDEEDRLSVYLNAITSIFDPHTNYFPPDDKENFDIRMSGQLEGIGATLQEKDGYIQVAEIVPGSASYRQGELAVDDIIIKVAQGKEEAVDIVDMRLDDAVKLIRGPKGTEVRLTVKKGDGGTKIISIIRDVVILEETFAKSAIIQNEYTKGKGVGYIKLPKFYADFQNKNGRSCAKDVRAELEKLKAENVEGVVLDLRNNGGGSLMDVVEMAGLFIADGPIVQVRARYGEPQVLQDDDRGVVYDGPLVILVNSSSASASEILAAAMQDYRRGVVVGTPTFGKGTVQRFFDLDNFIRGASDIKPLGSVKLTTQKFYRVNGGATQLRGVTPDVPLPDAYTYVDRGEKEQEYVMPWDEIVPCKYASGKLDQAMITKLRKASHDRTDKDASFTLVEENAKRLKTQRDQKTRTLNLDDYLAEEKKLKEEGEAYKNAFHTLEGTKVINLQADLASINEDSVRQKLNNDWVAGLQKDIYIHEASAIIKDMK